MDIPGTSSVSTLLGSSEGIVIEDNLGLAGSGGGTGFDSTVSRETVVL
jgi:hypothetical protein